MKILFNKFVILIIISIFSLIWYQIYQINKSLSYKDTNSYYYIIKWNWYIRSLGIKKIMKETSSKEILKAWDIVSTIWAWSLGIIEWWDNSITRIWWNSKLEIKEADIQSDLSSIKINFKLIEWKSWSNVVSMFDSNSYFNEEFQDVIAWVRWTVFEVNLDNDYVYVKDHQIEINNINNNKSQTIKSWEYFSLNFLEIIKNIDIKARDILWQNLNENIDKDYIINLKNEALKKVKEYERKFNINNYLDSKYKIISELNKQNPDEEKIKEIINDLSTEDKNNLYYMLMFDYQRLNIVDSDSQLFTKKMLYRDILMSLASDDNKKTILKYTFYDLNDSLNDYSWANLNTITSFLWTNKNYIDSLWVDTSVVDLSWKNLDLAWLKTIMWDNIQDLENILWVEKLKTLKWNSIKETLDNANNAAKQKVNDTLNNLFNIKK